jgi:Ser/Thr protein kinase RdoA (MazF antagonist)
MGSSEDEQVNSVAAVSSWNLRAEASPTTSPRVTKLQTPAGCFYLKESESAETVERHLDLLEHLASVALPVPRYIATAAGQRYAIDEGKVFWLSPALAGHHFAQFHGPSGLEQVERLALRLGELHPALASAPSSQLFPVFHDSAEHLLATLLAGASPFDVDRLQHLRGKVASLAALPMQLIHRDFHRGNVLFAGEAVSGFLDFDLVHQGPRLFDVCYCASGVLSESFREAGYAEYWLTIVETIFRAYGRSVGLSTQERSLAWSMLITIELIFMKGCLGRQDHEAALMNQGMLFWFEDHRIEIEAAIAS